MLVTILAPGSRGDVQPYVAIAKGLSAAGHGVRLVTTRDHASLVREHGVELRQVDFDVRAALEEAEAAASLEGGSVIASFRTLSGIAGRVARMTAEVARDAAKGADVLVAGFGGVFLGAAIAEATGVRLVQAYNVPISSTAAIPGALAPWLPLHRLGHAITRQVLWATARASAESVRRELFGLGASPFLAPFDGPVLGAGPLLYGFPSAIVPRPSDWPDRAIVTGAWFLDEAPGFAPSPELAAFLAAGAPPVYVGFGSMSSKDPKASARLVLDAVMRTGRRAILHRGWGGLGPGDLPSNVIAIDSVPHAWLFPRTSAVVHHGGAGTTAAGLRAGVPSIVVPFHGDQPFWGDRVAAAGVGPKPIPRRALTVDRLAAAIDAATGDAAMRDRAAAIGRAVRAEDGVARAVEVIGRVG